MSKPIACAGLCGRSLIGSEKLVGRCVDCDETGSMGIFRCYCGNPIPALGVQCESCNVGDYDGAFSKVPSKGTFQSLPSILKFTPTACTHEGSPLVLTIGKGQVFAGGAKTSAAWTCQPNLMVRLLGSIDPVFQGTGELGKHLAAKWEAIQPVRNYLCIDWKDMSAPPFGIEVVRDLIEVVSSGTDILIYCLGGHGRTGTLLAAMALLSGQVPEGRSSWSHIRSIYCQRAVESMSQENWLTDLEKE